MKFNEEKVARPRRRVRHWLARKVRPRSAKQFGGWRDRVTSLLLNHHPWWDWGHWLMILFGDNDGGNWAEPSAPTWWYIEAGTKRMIRTGDPRRTFRVVKDYDEFRSLTDGLNEDEMYRWKALCLDGDGELQLGHRYWGKAFYGLPHDELRLLRRYLRMVRRHGWFGVRSWLYFQGLHAAVNRKKPWSCGAIPPKGMGGYSHWRCILKRRHDGMHRCGNYVWGEVGGEPIGTLYEPQTAPTPSTSQEKE